MEVESIVTYNVNTITLTENDLLSAVKAQVQVFNENNLNDFNTTFRYSKLVESIDSVNSSIISNTTDVIAYKALNPILNTSTPLTIKFNNPLKILNSVYKNPQVSNPAVTSSFFTYDGVLCKLEDDGNGVVRIVSLELNANDIPNLLVNMGTVDYNNGTINLNELNISAYEGPYIKVKVITSLNDVSASLNNIIRIQDEDIFITANSIRQ